MKPKLLALGLAALVGALALSGALASHTVVHAAATQIVVTGVVSQQPDDQLAIDDGLNTYYLVSGIDFSQFIGPTVVLGGGLDQGTLYVTNLTLGAIQIADQHGAVTISTIGTVEQTGDAFQSTIEGIVFTLFGDGLDQAVGQTVAINGELTGTDITVTSFG
jgi:hypothetical protein